MNQEIFSDYPSSSRLWIFQADRIMSSADKTTIEQELHTFLASWKSHGNSMLASFKILHNHFILVALNTTTGHEASGCGIDALVHQISSTGAKTNINFLNNANIAFQTDQGIRIVNHAAVKKEIEQGLIKPDDKVFINSITSLSDLDFKWIVPANQSWLGRFFKNKLTPLENLQT